MKSGKRTRAKHVKTSAKRKKRDPLKDKIKGYSIHVCIGTGGIAAGSEGVIQAFERHLSSRGLSGKASKYVKKTGCRGFCSRDVLVDIISDKGSYTYQFVKPEMVDRLIEEHIVHDQPIMEWLVGPEYHAFHEKQKKIVLKWSGKIDPEDIEDYIKVQGYQAAPKAIHEMEPMEVADEIKASGLRGRGGAGFSTGLKWNLCRLSQDHPKYIICNADEGDPGAFMDRSIIEGNPHSVIEGMIIGGYAIGANLGYVYIRAEYPLAIKRLKIAIEQCKERNILGHNILGSKFDFDIKIKQGAGAFICGEETALIASLEGKRGIPRSKPPFPVNKGLWGKPTVINNVETLANVPVIIRKGAPWYASIGLEKSPGTKVFSLTGKIRHTGLIEVPMGITLKEIIYDIGGGIPGNHKFKAVQTGGPLGGCIPKEHIDTSVDFESLIKVGSMMGSGGMVILDESSCMVDIARFFLSFIQKESCGKCVPCRIGTKRMLEIITRITEGKGKESDLDLLEELSQDIKDSALCGLGQLAPNPVISTIKYFRDEYETHIKEKRCPAGVCEALRQYVINPDKCKRCGKCKRVCPSGAIEWRPKSPAYINKDICIRCGACFNACPFHGAIT